MSRVKGKEWCVEWVRVRVVGDGEMGVGVGNQ